MSIAFPAFERAQHAHMGFDRSRESSSLFDSQAPAGPSHTRAQSSLDLGLKQADTAGETTQPEKPVITKRINARLQLAAALIEADNDQILERAQSWNPAYQPGAPRPPPPPEPRLASQSAIFAPYRDTPGPKLPHHSRTLSNASRLSRLTANEDGRRPSVDYLGVALPTERRAGARSRPGSSVGAYDTRSRASSLLSTAGALGAGESVMGRPSFSGSVLAASELADAGDDALSEWGVEKFLSTEERERIAVGRRSRANSVVGITTAAPADSTDSSAAWDKRASVVGRHSVDGLGFPSASLTAGKATSDIGASSARPTDSSRLDLLARIKLYRERQENLPPSQWDGPGPTATKEEVMDHIIALSPKTQAKPIQPEDQQNRSISVDLSAANDTTQLPVQDGSTGFPSPNPAAAEDTHVPTEKASDYEETVRTSISNRHRSTVGILGDSWSDHEQGSDSEDKDKVPVPASAPEAVQDATQPSSEAKSDGFTVPPSPDSRPPRPERRIPVAAPAPVFTSFSLATDEQLRQAFNAEPAPSAIEASQQTSSVQSPSDQYQEADDTVGMAGVGSGIRSRSRRNSLMGGGMLTGVGSGAATPIHSLSRPGTPSATLGLGRIFPDDPFGDIPLGPGPFPMPTTTGAMGTPRARMMDLNAPAVLEAGLTSPPLGPTRVPGAGLSTRQLQAIARNTTFPEHFGINAANFDLDDQRMADDGAEDEYGNPLKPRASVDAAELELELSADDLAKLKTHLGGGVPDLSSANWGKPKKKWYRTSLIMLDGKKLKKAQKAQAKRAEDDSEEEEEEEANQKAVDDDEDDDDRPLGLGPRRDVSEQYAAEPVSQVFKKLQSVPGNKPSDDIDDDYISPPAKGPLRPLGISARLPKTLTMPPPLQGTKLAPKIRLTGPDPSENKRQSQIYVPDGFVLHDGHGLPPTRSLQVSSATGPKPLFSAQGGNQALEVLISDIKSIEVSRTLHVPAAAPAGIGRRAAAPTTALFRNQLVQHDEEREGWGWEAGTRAEDAFKADESSSSDGETPLADLQKKQKKQSRAAKRAEKRLAKLKRKRKAARRLRRAKREQAISEGRTFEELGVEELSPDEDLDLSSTTTGSETEEETDDETETDDSEAEKRWIDDSKPAGKLFGKSLLDIADERNQTRVNKARFYGQVQLEEEEAREHAEAQKAASMLGVPGKEDGASIAPSVTTSFRDRPVGYNDTRERMEAVFGTDLNWAREMEKRREEEAREKEEAEIARLAEIEFQKAEKERLKRKKDRRIFGKDRNKAKNKKDKNKLGDSPSAGSETTLAKTMPDAAKDEAEEDGAVSPVRSRTPVNAPVIDLQIGEDDDAGKTEGRHGRRERKGVSEAAAEWFAPSSDESSTEYSSSEDEAERRREAMQRARLSRHLGGGADSRLLAAAAALPEDGASSEDDHMPLSQLRQKVASRPVSLASGLMLNGGNVGATKDESSDEELPLAALKAKRQQEAMKLGKLDLDFGSELQAKTQVGQPPQGRTLADIRSGNSSRAGIAAVWTADDDKIEGEGEKEELLGGREDGGSDSDSDVPLGLRHPNGAAVLAASATATGGRNGAGPLDSEDEEDDKPLGTAHPQAAIIAEQAALIRQLQAEKEGAARMSMGMPMGGMGMGMGMPPPPAMGMGMGMGIGMGMGMGSPSILGMGPGPAPAPAGPMGSMPSMLLDPKSSTIHNWRSQVPADATATVTPPGSGSAINSSQ